jgi:hypothetical protein
MADSSIRSRIFRLYRIDPALGAKRTNASPSVDASIGLRANTFAREREPLER